MMGRQRRCRWAQPWTLLLLLLGPQLLVTHGWRPQGNENSKNRNILKLYFPAVVEYALHVYNLKSQDRNAYKVVRVLRSWPEWKASTSHSEQKEEKGLVFSMELQFARIRCGKFDEDIDNCPFQATPDVNNTVTCFFTVDAKPWKTEFQLLNDTCLEGSAA
ncbi:cystatin-9 [Capricornis sumatraensis]|uniref:cystatin-9 n=1 Tax=Capricornis sumatraensis TaxID=34865 RepID=UPI0036047F59